MITPRREQEASAAGAAALNLTSAAMLILLGDSTFEIYLNNVAYWKNIPSSVWEYTIGGYQVIKKWLTYREFASGARIESRLILGRSLTDKEVREVTGIARRITDAILLTPDLDVNYAAAKQDTYCWPSAQSLIPADVRPNE